MIKHPLSCPRCDSDNRYWFEIKYDRRPEQMPFLAQVIPALGRFVGWLAPLLRRARDFPLAALSLLAPVALIVWILIRHFDEGNPINSLALVLATILVGIITSASMVGKWRQVREEAFFRYYCPPQNLGERIPAHVQSGLRTFLLFGVLIPVIIYFAVPAVDNLSIALLNLKQRSSTNDRLISLKSSAETMAQEIKQANLPQETLDELIPMINMVITSTKSLITTTRSITVFNESAPGQPFKIYEYERGRQWGKMIFLAWLATFILAYVAVNNYLAEIDAFLPPPVFVSVASMTQVAVKDARETLQISPEELEKIEWMDARRNERGGISLHGLRELTSETYHQPARHRTYIIETDRWVRIQEIKTQNGH